MIIDITPGSNQSPLESISESKQTPLNIIPGSNQSPSDIDTMVMVLNDAGDQYVEQYKPVDEVRTVALARLDAVYLATTEWHTEADASEKEKAALDTKRDKRVAAINAETNPQKLLEIAVEPFVFPLVLTD